MKIVVDPEAARDDQLDEAQRLRQPDRRDERSEDDGARKDDLAKDVSRDLGHRSVGQYIRLKPSLDRLGPPTRCGRTSKSEAGGSGSGERPGLVTRWKREQTENERLVTEHSLLSIPAVCWLEIPLDRSV